MSNFLPKNSWTQRADLAQLVTILGTENIRWVGGAVRDTLIDHPVKDVDAATTLAPKAVMELLDLAGMKVIPTGIDHGTVTAVLDGGPVEITTLRQDLTTDGRRATVEFASDWRDDAARRDFTINALYAHPETLEISDYFGGLDDLTARRVRFIGDAETRIREDHLRILRYFRFQARFGSELDAEAEQACSALADTLMGLSRERVAMELLALLALPDPGPTVRRMRANGVLPVILPETGNHELDVLERLIVAEQAQNFAADPLRRMAALLPTVAAVAEAAALRLRLSRTQRARLSCVAARSDEDVANPLVLAYNEGVDCAVDRLLVAGHDAIILKDWHAPTLPLKGGEIVSRGVDAGPEVARILQSIERQWVVEGFPDRTRVEAMLGEHVAQV